VLAVGDEVLDIEVQRRSLFRELGEVGRPRVERTVLQHVEDGDHGQDPVPARRARRHRRRLESVGEAEQQHRLSGVEDDAVAVVVDDGEGAVGGVGFGGRHARKVPLAGPDTLGVLFAQVRAPARVG